MTAEKIIGVVINLNERLPEYYYYKFSYQSIGFCEAILFADIVLWDSENDDRAYIEDREEKPNIIWDEEEHRQDLEQYVLEEFDKVVSVIFKASTMFKKVEEALNHVYTDILMVDEGNIESLQDNCEGTLHFIEVISKQLWIDLEDTRGEDNLIEEDES